MNEQDKNTYEKIVEIIVYVISELKHHKNIAEIDLKELQQKGYSSSEISTAFSWIVDKIEFNTEVFIAPVLADENSFRILHEAEKDLFTQEAWGDLIQLHSLGIIKNEHIEAIIERTLMLGLRKIESPHLKGFVAMTIFNYLGNDLPGSRLMLTGNETVN
jgi:uncharacterized protein Smg (DUF494 family)